MSSLKKQIAELEYKQEKVNLLKSIQKAATSFVENPKHKGSLKEVQNYLDSFIKTTIKEIENPQEVRTVRVEAPPETDRLATPAQAAAAALAPPQPLQPQTEDTPPPPPAIPEEEAVYRDLLKSVSRFYKKEVLGVDKTGVRRTGILVSMGKVFSRINLSGENFIVTTDSILGIEPIVKEVIVQPIKKKGNKKNAKV